MRRSLQCGLSLLVIALCSSGWAAGTQCPPGYVLDDNGDCVKAGGGGSKNTCPSGTQNAGQSTARTTICASYDNTGHVTYAETYKYGVKHTMQMGFYQNVTGVRDCSYFTGAIFTYYIAGFWAGDINIGLCGGGGFSPYQVYEVESPDGSYVYSVNTQNQAQALYRDPNGNVTSRTAGWVDPAPGSQNPGFTPNVTPSASFASTISLLAPATLNAMNNQPMGPQLFVARWIIVVGIVGNIACGISANLLTNPAGWNAPGLVAAVAAGFVCGAGAMANYYMLTDTNQAPAYPGSGDGPSPVAGMAGDGSGDGCIGYGTAEQGNPCVPHRVME